MRDEDQPFLARFEAAKAAAPYCHPRLQSVAVHNEDDNKILIQFVDFNQKPVTNGGTIEAPCVAVIEHHQQAEPQAAPLGLRPAMSAALGVILDDEFDAAD